jgi:hypothetical protein
VNDKNNIFEVKGSVEWQFTKLLILVWGSSFLRVGVVIGLAHPTDRLFFSLFCKEYLEPPHMTWKHTVHFLFDIIVMSDDDNCSRQHVQN